MLFKKKIIKKPNLREEIGEDTLGEGLEADSNIRRDDKENDTYAISKSSKNIKKGKFFGFQVQKFGGSGMTEMMGGNTHDGSGITDKEFLRQTGAEKKDKQLENFLEQKLKEFHHHINKNAEIPAPITQEKENPLSNLSKTLDAHKKQSMEELKRLSEFSQDLHETAREKSILMTGLRELETPLEEKLRILEESERNKRCIILQHDIKKEDYKREEKQYLKELDQRKKDKRKRKDEIALKKRFKQQGRLYRMEMLKKNLCATMIESTAIKLVEKRENKGNPNE